MWNNCTKRFIRGGYSVERVLSSSAKTNGVKVTHTRGAAPHPSNTDTENATTLVDGLIEYTRQLMENNQNHIVAYSGGVDSSLVAALLQQAAASSQDQHNVLAVLGISPAVSQEQIQQARDVASFLNLKLREVHTTEGSDKMYIENNGKACLACKTHLYESLQAVYRVSSSGARPINSTRLYNGTNADDLQDSTRVGLIAAHDFGVESPLQRITKQQVRIAARHLNLPNWNAAAAPCLRSRLVLGVQASQQHLSMIEQAERFVRTVLLDEKLHAASNMRVRMLTNQRAMIEVDGELLSEFNLGTVEQAYFQSLGFSSVSARPFRTGSVARRWERTAASSDDGGGMLSMGDADSNVNVAVVAAVG